MFQRARPLASDADLGNFYGLALPLIMHFSISNIDARDDHDVTAVRLLLPHAAKSVSVDGKPFAFGNADAGTVLLELPAHAAAQQVKVTF